MSEIKVLSNKIKEKWKSRKKNLKMKQKYMKTDIRSRKMMKKSKKFENRDEIQMINFEEKCN